MPAMPGTQEKEFVNFCEAQMVWDKSMAWHLMGYLKKNPDTTMVVLAGVGHAWKRGISEQLDERRSPTGSFFPVIPDQIERGHGHDGRCRLRSAGVARSASRRAPLPGRVSRRLLFRDAA